MSDSNTVAIAIAHSTQNVGIGTTNPSEKLHVVGDILAQGDIIAENYIVKSSVTQLTQSFSSGSTIFGDTPASDKHQFTGSMFISGSGNPSLTVDGKIALRSGTPGNQQISFGNTDQFIQGHDNYIIFDGDDQVVIDNKESNF